MTDTTTVDPQALLAEILLTPEGKADPYPRYAAIREHAARVPGRPRVHRRRRLPLRGLPVGPARPAFGKGTDVTPWEQYGLTEQEWDERFGELQPADRPRCSA